MDSLVPRVSRVGALTAFVLGAFPTVGTETTPATSPPRLPFPFPWLLFPLPRTGVGAGVGGGVGAGVGAVLRVIKERVSNARHELHEHFSMTCD